MLFGNRKLESSGCKIDRDGDGDVGNREAITGHVLGFAQLVIEIGVEIQYARRSSLSECGNLLVVMRTGYGSTFESRHGVANGLHHRGETFEFRASLPHGRQCSLLRRCADKWRLGIDLLDVAKDGGNLTDTRSIVEH